MQKYLSKCLNQIPDIKFLFVKTMWDGFEDTTLIISMKLITGNFKYAKSTNRLKQDFRRLYTFFARRPLSHSENYGGGGVRADPLPPQATALVLYYTHTRKRT